MIHTNILIRLIRSALIPGALFSVLFFSGCLTADHKEVRLTLNADGKSGTGKITFTNLALLLGI